VAERKDKAVMELIGTVWKRLDDQSEFSNYSIVLILRADQGSIFVTNITGARPHVGLVVTDVVNSLAKTREDLLARGIWRP
jgi:hypothetical protein